MRLPISVTPSKAGQSVTESTCTLVNGETIIVELQGKLEISSHEKDIDEASARAGLEIGKLDVSDPKKPLLTIGNHQLEGKIVEFASPLTLLRKIELGALSSPADSQTQLDIIAIVNRKFVFSKRPHPIVKMESI
ncbi:Ctf8-domain-containing protein [Melampsora americana]|nr:Ctf8-domain-containing protein [Melampsora americana]